MPQQSEDSLMEKIVSLCKRRGFVFPSSEIYGGFAATYDFGPLGFLLKKNLEKVWRKWNVDMRDDVVEIEGAIFMHPRVWEASGHVGGFADVLVEDLITNKRYRADHLIEEAGLMDNAGGLSLQEIDDLIKSQGLRSPDGNPLSSAKKFNQLVKTHLGATEDDTTLVYLKGESCQNIYLDFKLVQETMRLKLPFGIAQIGKAFRNEITVKNFIFRTREFEQMDIQYFCRPEDADRYYEEWRANRWSFYTEFLGFSPENVRWRQHSKDERAFYARDAWDVQYRFGEIGFEEIEGVHHRGDYDLTQHQKFSGTDLSYLDQITGERFIPFIVECSGGFNRLFLAAMFEAYREEGEGDKKRVYLKLPPKLAPYKAAVFPLLANKPELVAKAKAVYQLLTTNYSLLPIAWDDRGNIGKRYFSQDEIGTPYCITIDFDTLGESGSELKDTVTVRDRDSGTQERLPIADLKGFLASKLEG
jgi:glycyl-tRNA synthetase